MLAKKPRPDCCGGNEMMSSSLREWKPVNDHDRACSRPKRRDEPAQTDLERPADDLLQRRVGDQQALDQARRLRIGARQLGSGRSAVGLRVAAEGRQAAGELIGQAGVRIEARERVIASELVLELFLFAALPRRAEFSLSSSLRVVVAAADGQGEAIGQVQGVGEVEAEIVALVAMSRAKKSSPSR